MRGKIENNQGYKPDELKKLLIGISETAHGIKQSLMEKRRYNAEKETSKLQTQTQREITKKNELHGHGSATSDFE